MLKTISITISGKVQGVFFRQYTREKALLIGVTGTVSNEPDGTVHIIATGSAEQLNELAAWCYQGPPKASVTSVTLHDLNLRTFESFTILRH